MDHHKLNVCCFSKMRSYSCQACAPYVVNSPQISVKLGIFWGSISNNNRKLCPYIQYEKKVYCYRRILHTGYTQRYVRVRPAHTHGHSHGLRPRNRMQRLRQMPASSSDAAIRPTPRNNYFKREREDKCGRGCDGCGWRALVSSFLASFYVLTAGLVSTVSQEPCRPLCTQRL